MNGERLGKPKAPTGLSQAFAALKRKHGTNPLFEAVTGIHPSLLNRVLNRRITMSPETAIRLASHSKRSAKSWMNLWVDHWFSL